MVEKSFDISRLLPTMNNIFNKVVVTMLSKYLQYYMNDFSRDSFKLQIMKGTFDLEDMGA